MRSAVPSLNKAGDDLQVARIVGQLYECTSVPLAFLCGSGLTIGVAIVLPRTSNKAGKMIKTVCDKLKNTVDYNGLTKIQKRDTADLLLILLMVSIGVGFVGYKFLATVVGYGP